MDLNDFDYELPAERIAQHPRPERGQSRLLVLHRDGSGIEHRTFSDLSQYIQAGDCLVINDTKVIPARFFIQRATGGRIEGLFIKIDTEKNWQVLLKNASRLRPNEVVSLINFHGSNQTEAPKVTRATPATTISFKNGPNT